MKKPDKLFDNMMKAAEDHPPPAKKRLRPAVFYAFLGVLAAACLALGVFFWLKGDGGVHVAEHPDNAREDGRQQVFIVTFPQIDAMLGTGHIVEVVLASETCEPKKMSLKKAAVSDLILTLMSGKRPEDLMSADGQKVLRAEIAGGMKRAFGDAAGEIFLMKLLIR